MWLIPHVINSMPYLRSWPLPEDLLDTGGLVKRLLLPSRINIIAMLADSRCGRDQHLTRWTGFGRTLVLFLALAITFH
jgi:hypothetical protein